MTTQIETLKRDIHIHKEVEKELAKRSHFCQKVIKRLKDKVKSLEAELKGEIGQEPGSALGLLSGRGKGCKSGLIAPASTRNRNAKVA